MGKTKQYEQMLSTLMNQINSQFASSQQAAAQESPYLTQLGKDATSFLDTVRGGDLRNLKMGTFWNMSPLADRQKQRNLLANSGATGQAALAGGGNASLMALDKANRDAEFEADYANDFQNAVIGQTNAAKDTIYGLGQLEQNRRTGAASNNANLLGMSFNAINNKPKGGFLSSLFGGAMSALPGVIGALGDGGEMEPGGTYRIGSENVEMLEDGRARVTPSRNPIAKALQKMAERVDLAHA